MAIISLICKQCAGQMELDDTRDVCFCGFCGTKHIIKDEIVNNTVINNYGQSSKGADELIADGKVLLDLGQIPQAYAKFKSAIDAAPNDHRAWLGSARVLAVSKTESDRAYEAAYKLANGPEKDIVIGEWISGAALKDEAGCRRTYEHLIGTFGDGVKERTLTIWTDEVRKDVSERKKFAATYYQSSAAVTDGYRTLPGGVYYSPYGLFKIETVFGCLNDDEKIFVISGMRDEIDAMEVYKDRFFTDNGNFTPAQLQQKKQAAIRMGDTVPYTQYVNAIAALRACVGRLDAASGNAKDDPAQKKKSFWSRK